MSVISIEQVIDGEIIRNLGKPTRMSAPFRYPGGKGNIVKKILSHLPKGKIYVEPFCGAASIFWHLPQPYQVEVLNDLDGEIINLFRVLQEKEKFKTFLHKIIWTPYARAEYAKALEYCGDDDVERAWAFYVKKNMGHNATGDSIGRWGRTFKISCGMADTSNSWRHRLKLLCHWHDRLTRVQIDNRDALEVIRYWDTPETVFYIDPPYVNDTRITKKLYKCEMSNDEHRRLVEVLNNLKGQYVLSGYMNDIYKDLINCQMIQYETQCHLSSVIRSHKRYNTGKRNAPRTECLWVKTHEKGNGLFY